ncbi:MAG: LysR family transcriptional regulator [Proteobacteria bacterium]|nr:LysR family transcriptional regulator [Pseudomonadota bacterium]
MPNRSRLTGLPLSALRAFDAAARLGSFKDAAGELAVTPAAISHQVKALEARLGVTLFDRLNRALRLTSAGRRLARVTADSFGRLERGLRALESAGVVAGAATLTISSAPSIAAKWLVPRLHGFQAAHSDIELRLQSGDTLADVTAGTVDIALRYGAGKYGAGTAEDRLWPQGSIIAVCAPTLAPIGKVAEVTKHPLLRTAMPAARRRAGKGTGQDEFGGWVAWLAAAGLDPAAIPPKTLRGPLFGSSHLAIDAALAGRGLALAPRILVADDLAAVRLIQPFPIAIPDPFTYWLVYAAARAKEPRIRAFLRWIGQEAALSRKQVK